MRWRRVRPEDEESIRGFLSTRENRCLAAAARFLERDASRDRAWLADDGEIRAFLFLGAGGAFLPVFDATEIVRERRAATRRVVVRCLRHRPPRSIQATADDAAVAEEALAKLGRDPNESIDYILMGLDGKPNTAALDAGPRDLVVRRAGRSDADLLFPLQAAYEREEVVPRGAELNPAACRFALERTLASRIVLYAELEGRPVAKANTNARSYVRDQVGGVYVLPELRGRGIATRLVAELVALLVAEGREASLFVKKRNEAAIAAYRRIGFDVRGDYRISYY